MYVKEQTAIYLRPWSDADLPLLERLMGDPAMTEYLGGPESPERILERHKRYVRSSEPGQAPMFVIVADPQRQPAGMIGYWEHEAEGMPAWETGWSVLKEFQGQGIATKAALLVAERVRAERKYPFLHAFPGVDNGASNAVCRKAGFVLLGEVVLEYPQGSWMRCNDWSINLLAEQEADK